MNKCAFCKYSYPSSNMNGNNPNGWQCELYYLDDRKKGCCEEAIKNMFEYNKVRSGKISANTNETAISRREKLNIQIEIVEKELMRDFFQQFDKVLRMFEIHFQNGKPFIYFDRVQNMFDFEEKIRIFSEYNEGSNVGYCEMSMITGINGNPMLVIKCKRV